MIPALVLTAGLATRLRPLSLVRAKAAMPVAGAPLVIRILRWLRDSGVTSAVLNLHHLPHSITQHVGDGSDLGLSVRYSWEVPLLGSAGGPRRAAPLFDSNTFLIVNGDTLAPVPLDRLIEAHRESGALVTMAVTASADSAKYGGLVIDDSGAFTGVAARGSMVESRHFVGVQVAEASAFSAVPPGTPAESVREVYPALIRSQPGSVRTFDCDAEFFDIGAASDYLSTSLAIAGRDGGALIGKAARIDPGAVVTESILWDNVVVGAGARLHRCVVTDDVDVPGGTSCSEATIRPWRGDLVQGERRVGNLSIAPLSPG
jgi:mannose-1-phosphate guanylyltransferase